jgi:hypothetical protein
MTIFIVVLVSLFATTAPASTPPYSSPAPVEFLKLLDLLDRGNVTIGELREVLAPILERRFGPGYEIGVILNEAVRQGALRHEDVVAAMGLEGCFLDKHRFDPGPCGSLVSLIRLGQQQDRILVASALSAAEKQAALESLRKEVLASRCASGPSGADPCGEYGRALILANPQPLAAGFRLFASQSLDEVPEAADRDAARSMAQADNARATDQVALMKLRRAIATAMLERLHNSMGRPEVVEEVRATPEGVLRAALGTDQFLVPSMLDLGGHSSTGCVVAAWRAPKEAPSQWHAWRLLLQCDGVY